MSDSVEFIGRATLDGHFKPDNPKMLGAVLTAKASKKKPPLLKMTLEDWKPEQTDTQRALWFVSVVKPFCEKQGYRFANENEKMLVHHQILVELGRYEIVRVFGKEVKAPLSMKKGSMTVQEFQELYEDAQRLAAEWDVPVRDLSPSELEAMRK